jgi:hypothetical protein
MDQVVWWYVWTMQTHFPHWIWCIKIKYAEWKALLGEHDLLKPHRLFGFSFIKTRKAVVETALIYCQRTSFLYTFRPGKFTSRFTVYLQTSWSYFGGTPNRTVDLGQQVNTGIFVEIPPSFGLPYFTLSCARPHMPILLPSHSLTPCNRILVL